MEVFLVHLSSVPWPKAGMTSFETRLLGKEKLSIFCRAHEKIELVSTLGQSCCHNLIFAEV
jgi:hypothetical protein